MSIKIRFLEAISSGDLGEVDDSGVIVSIEQFKTFFKNEQPELINSFLPAAVLDAGHTKATHTKFLFRLRKGVYRVHDDAMDAHVPESQVRAKSASKPVVITEKDTAKNMLPEAADTSAVSVIASIEQTEEQAFPALESTDESPRKKPVLEKTPASQMNNKVEEAMMKYMTYRLN